MTLAADGNVAAILSNFGGDPQRAEGLAAFLGFEPISNPEDRLTGALSAWPKAVPAWPWRRRIWHKRTIPCWKLQGGPGRGRSMDRRTL